MFKEFLVLFITVAMLHQNAYGMPRGKGRLFIVEIEGHKIDCVEWTRKSILWEIAANRKKSVVALAH